MTTATASGGQFTEFDSSWKYQNFTISLDAPAASPVTVPWTITGTSAKDRVDHFPSSRYAGTVTFQPGETVEQVRFGVYGDAVPEVDEAVTFTIYSSPNVDLPDGAATHSAVAWINDDDGAVSPTALWVSDPVIVEGDDGTAVVRYRLVLSRTAEDDVEIPYQLVGDSAEAGSDFRAASGAALILQGDTETVVSVTVLADEIREGIEYADLELDLPGGIAEAHGGRITIVDDDHPNALPTVLIAAESFTEDDSSWTYQNFTVSLSAPAASPVTVPWTISGGAATDRVDHFPSSRYSGTVTFRPGETVEQVRFGVYGDAVPETDESVEFTVGAPTGPATLPGGVAEFQTVGWIEDDDGSASPLALFVTSPHVIEGDDGQAIASFDFELSRPAPRDLEITYETLDGTAEDADDYVDASGTVTILEGQHAATVSVRVLGDTKYEPGGESLRLRTLLPPEIAEMRGGTAVIQDDDSAAEFWRQVGTPGGDDLRGYEYADDIRAGGGGDRIWGYGGADRLIGAGGNDVARAGTGDDFVYGQAGNDTLHGDGGNDFLDGGSGNDRLIGGDGGDRLLGRGGIDTLSGGDGNDRQIGGGGDDRVDGGNGDDWLTGDAGDDAIFGRAGADTLIGGSGADNLVGGGGNDRLYGRAGPDTLSGGAGNDRLIGGGGNDRLDGGGGDDRLDGGGGDDRLLGRGGTDVLIGGAGDDRLEGGGGDDRLFGRSGADTLIGGGGDDRLIGGGGADRLDGGRGSDDLRGGGGRDEFVFGARDGRDTIFDFADGVDVIVVESGADRFSEVDVLDRGRDALIRFADTTIVLRNEDHRDLDAGDFVFT